MPPANPHGTTVDHFISSNSTTQHFLGGVQRGWMTNLGNNPSLNPSSLIRPGVTSLTSTSTPNGAPSDETTARPAVQRSPAQPPSRMQPTQTQHTQASNVRWATVNIPRPIPAKKRSFDAAFVQPTATMKSSLEQRQQPQPEPPATAAALSPLSPSRGITQETLPRLNAFLEQIRTKGHANDFVRYRAAILADACIYQDTFYLSFHQIFCKATTDPFFTMQIGFGDEELGGIDTIQAILLPNGDLPPDALKFFASFPYPDPARISPIPGHMVAQIRAFISGLDRKWQNLRQACIARGYPPFADELRARLQLGSTVFQRVLFNLIHQQLARVDSPVWTEQAHRLFEQNQRESQQRWDVSGYALSDEQVEIEARQLGGRYLKLLATLQQASFEISSVLGMSSTGGDNGVTQPPSVAGPGTATSPDQHLPPSHYGTIRWVQDAHSPSNVQDPSSQGHPRVNHLPQPLMQHQYAVTNTQQHHSQVAMNAGNRIRQAQPRRRGRPPLSHNRQSSRRPAAPISLVNQSTSISPGINLTPDHGRHLNITAPPAITSPGRGSNTSDVPYPLFLPQLGQEPIQGINQNYKIVALHQAHLRSPKYQISGSQDVTNPAIRLYQVPSGCVLSPQILGQSCPYFNWQFEVSADHFERKAKDFLSVSDPANPALAELIRRVTGGSLLYRLKCVEVSANTIPTSMPEDVWVTRETVWPSGVFLAFNNQQLEVRRKLHHGKDLTIDITQYLKGGLNTLTCSVLRTTEETKLGKNFAIAVEVIEIITDDRIKDLPVQLKEPEARSIITKSLNRGLHGKSDGSSVADKDKDEDEEILIIDAHISIDITDPYTARVFEVPVRGKKCLHRECFDLQTFLETRKARTSERDRETAPTSPDEWKCPICKKDARPQNLVIDGFLQKVRKELAERDQLDVKAIRVQADGTWEAVIDGLRGDRRDSTNTDDADGALSRRQNVATPGPGVTVERWMGPGQGESVVIELD